MENEIRIEKSAFNNDWYGYIGRDVRGDPNTTEEVRFEEHGPFSTEQEARDAMAAI